MEGENTVEEEWEGGGRWTGEKSEFEVQRDVDKLRLGRQGLAEARTKEQGDEARSPEDQ